MITLSYKNLNEFVHLKISCDKESEQIAQELSDALESHGWDTGDVWDSDDGKCINFELLKLQAELKKLD